MEVVPREINNSLCKLLSILQLLASGRPINKRALGAHSFYAMTMSQCWWPTSMVNIDYPAVLEGKEWTAGCWMGLFDWQNVCWLVNGLIKLPTVVLISVAVYSACPLGQWEMFNAACYKYLAHCNLCNCKTDCESIYVCVKETQCVKVQVSARQPTENPECCTIQNSLIDFPIQWSKVVSPPL